MKPPTKQHLLATVMQLQRVVQDMYSAYSDDVSPNRAEKMQALIMRGTDIAQPIINAFSFDDIQNAYNSTPTIEQEI